ncbi:MAG: hypothetical protein COA79_00205 [Planctomycetota bacterium]|nr:MAG: hypothetical protein COA79_00205 [Planctomycetota bacterium]
MSQKTGGSKILMVLNDLKDFPLFDYSDGYHWKWYSKGDEISWLNIQTASEPFIKMNEELYIKEFQKMYDDLCMRQGFLLNGQNEYVGTGTAWFDQYKFKEFGRVHWIALNPSEQGRGLSKLIVQETLLKLKELRYKSSYLYTSSNRIAAIKTYLSFGFLPDLTTEEYLVAWDEYLEHVK